jgi:hypothetical protein
MPPPIPLPADVQAWLRNAFGSCNEQVSAVVSRVPTNHETTLDMSFIDYFAAIATPVQFPSGWVVQISTHYLGGGRHVSDWPGFPRRWEIADIGVLVLFRQRGRLIRSKVALLQSKRLYPDELEWDEDSPLDYMAGFGRLMRRDDDWADVVAPRTFSFTPGSRYQALVTGVNQYKAIAQYEAANQIPVYYLLYHPWQIPHAVTFPLTAHYAVTGRCDVGCRVVPATQLRTALGGQPEGHSPAYEELRRRLSAPFTLSQHQAGWRLEHFVVDLLLNCETGYVASSPDDGGLNYIFNRRSGPISAAIALTIDAP